MATDHEFCEMMPHRVSIKPKASFNVHGERQFAATRTVCAYIDPPTKASQRGQRNTEDRGTRVIIADTSVTVDDVVVLPDGAERIVREIVDYSGIIDGLDHLEVMIE
jgi:hypothetical protein